MWLAFPVGSIIVQTIKLKVADPTTVGSMAAVWVAKEASYSRIMAWMWS